MEGRAARVGGVAAVAGDGGLTARLRSRGYRTQETPHFVVCRRPPAALTIVVHGFDEATVDEDLPELVAGELGGAGVVRSEREFGDALFAIVASTAPASLSCPTCGRLHLDHPAMWRHYCLNTLARLRPLVTGGGAPAERATAHVGLIAAVYRRILQLRVGASLLDVGSNLGIFPVLLAELAPDVAVTGCDNRPEIVVCAADLAAATGRTGVVFRPADLLAAGFPEIGRFDVVTAVHVLEHLDEAELPAALGNLLAVAARRLIVAVPYEEPAEPLYGHRQAFTPDRLRGWGRWCEQELGARRSWCEDVCGGLLVVELAQPGFTHRSRPRHHGPLAR